MSESRLAFEFLNEKYHHVAISFKKKSPIQGLSFAKSHEYSTYLTNLFFEDPESNRAKKFQESN